MDKARDLINKERKEKRIWFGNFLVPNFKNDFNVIFDAIHNYGINISEIKDFYEGDKELFISRNHCGFNIALKISLNYYCN